MDFKEVYDRVSEPGPRAYTRASWRGEGKYYTKLEILSSSIYMTGSI